MRRSDGAAAALGEVCPPDARAAAALDPAILNRAPAGAMRGLLRWLRRRHGSAEGYLKDAGLSACELTALREMLCAPEPRWLRAQQ